MGRPAGSKNKVKAQSNDVTVMTVEDFERGVPGDEDEAPVEVRNTDNDAPTQGQLAKAIQALADSAPVRRVPFAKFKTRSPFNPTGKRRKLSRRCYQNGYPMNIKTLHSKEIELLERLQPGKYINGMVGISVQENGGNTDLHIAYKNKNIDDRMANKSEWRNLEQLLQRCVDEAESGVLVAR